MNKKLSVLFSVFLMIGIFSISYANAGLLSWNGAEVDVDNTVSTESELQELIDNDGVNDINDSSEDGLKVVGINTTITLSSNLNVKEPDVIILSNSSSREVIDTGEHSIDIFADGVTIEGLDILGENDTNESTTDKGIRLKETRNGVTLKNNILRGSWEPIILNSAGVHHTNILIENNDISGEYIGIMAHTTSDSVINDNYIHDIDVGIEMANYINETTPTLTNNLIEYNKFENMVNEDDPVNEPDDSMWYYSILIQAKDTIIQHNEFIGGGDTEFGILATDSISSYGTGERDISNLTVENNDIYGYTSSGVIETEDSYSDLSPSGYTIDARNNWWGYENGCGGGISDPETGTTANGDGNNINGSVRFDPYLSSPVYGETITSCNLLHSQNTATTYYKLNNSISDFKGECFNLMNENITLDCQNHVLSGDTSLLNNESYDPLMMGVAIKSPFSSVKNCHVHNADWGFFGMDITDNSSIIDCSSVNTNNAIKITKNEDYFVENFTSSSSDSCLKLIDVNNSIFDTLNCNNTELNVESSNNIEIKNGNSGKLNFKNLNDLTLFNIESDDTIEDHLENVDNSYFEDYTHRNSWINLINVDHSTFDNLKIFNSGENCLFSENSNHNTFNNPHVEGEIFKFELESSNNIFNDIQFSNLEGLEFTDNSDENEIQGGTAKNIFIKGNTGGSISNLNAQTIMFDNNQNGFLINNSSFNDFVFLNSNNIDIYNSNVSGGSPVLSLENMDNTYFKNLNTDRMVLLKGTTTDTTLDESSLKGIYSLSPSTSSTEIYDSDFEGYTAVPMSGLECSAIINNNTANGKSLEFYNSQSTIENRNNDFGFIFLCGGDNSELRNISHTSSGSRVTGIAIQDSENVLVEDSTFNFSRGLDIMGLRNPSSVEIKDSIFSDYKYGIYPYVNSNIEIHRNEFIDPTDRVLAESSDFIGELTIYNNIFKNDNSEFSFSNSSSASTINWNIPKQDGQRLLEEQGQIGGNYWYDLDGINGSGYSITCEDSDEDGFCDTGFTSSDGTIEDVNTLSFGTFAEFDPRDVARSEFPFFMPLIGIIFTYLVIDGTFRYMGVKGGIKEAFDKKGELDVDLSIDKLVKGVLFIIIGLSLILVIFG